LLGSVWQWILFASFAGLSPSNPTIITDTVGADRMDKLLGTLVELEESLFTQEVRKSSEKLSELIHDDFEEVVSSGQILNKADVVAWLSKEMGYEIHASGYEVRSLSEEIALLKYKTKTIKDNNEVSYAIRASIWKHENKKWKMLYHQATLMKVDN